MVLEYWRSLNIFIVFKTRGVFRRNRQRDRGRVVLYICFSFFFINSYFKDYNVYCLSHWMPNLDNVVVVFTFIETVLNLNYIIIIVNIFS